MAQCWWVLAKKKHPKDDENGRKENESGEEGKDMTKIEGNGDRDQVEIA